MFSPCMLCTSSLLLTDGACGSWSPFPHCLLTPRTHPGGLACWCWGVEERVLVH